MKNAYIRKKKVHVCSAPARRDERIDEFKNATIALDDKLDEIIRQGGHVVYTDETVFKSRDFLR